jgi:hypothetical protein
VTAQVAELKKHEAGKVFREVASGAKAQRAQFRRVLDQLDAGDVLMVTRLDRLARSTRDRLNTLAAITERKAGFHSLGDTWADTTPYRPPNAYGARRPGRVRARSNPQWHGPTTSVHNQNRCCTTSQHAVASQRYPNPDSL